MVIGNGSVSQKLAFISSTPSKLSVFTQIAICAFLGIFSLFFFETIASSFWLTGTLNKKTLKKKKAIMVFKKAMSCGFKPPFLLKLPYVLF
jgi:hypothetical protein